MGIIYIYIRKLQVFNQLKTVQSSVNKVKKKIYHGLDTKELLKVFLLCSLFHDQHKKKKNVYSKWKKIETE